MPQQIVLLLVLESEVGVVVHLQEPESEVFIDQEVKSKQLEAELALFLVQELFSGENTVDYDVLHPRDYMVLNGYAVL